MSEPNPNPTPEPNPNPTPEPEKVSMTQAELDALIQGRIGAALSAADKKRTTVPKETLEELDRLRKAEQERERQELERKGKYEEALKNHAESIRKPLEEEKTQLTEKIGGLTGRLRDALVTNKLISAASAGNAYNADQVVQLNERFVRLDDDFNPIVVDKDGNQRFAAGGSPMTPEQLVEEFLRANPHLVKAPVGVAGGGAGGGASKHNHEAGPLQQKEAELEEARDNYRRSGNVAALSKVGRLTKEIAQLKAS